MRAREKDSLVAKRRFAVTDATKCGLRLNSTIGYNGEYAGENMVWSVKAGFLAYSVGSVVCVENLASSKQDCLIHPSQEDVTVVCLRPDHTELASATALNFSSSSSSSTYETATTSEQQQTAATTTAAAPKCMIYIWDCVKMKARLNLYHKNACNIACMKYSCDGRFLVSISDFNCPSLVVWRAWDSSYASLVFIDCLSYVINEIAWSPIRSSELIMCGQNKALVVCNIEEISTITAHVRFNELDVPLVISEVFL